LVIAPTLATMRPSEAAVTSKTQTVELSVVSTDTAHKMLGGNDTATTVTFSANTKTLVQALQEEGIAPTDNVKIMIKDGKITVNGKALTPEQNAKFASYIKKQ